MQNTNTVLMIRPVAFGYNAQTAINNKFQVAGNAEAAQAKALVEFDALVKKLEETGIDVLVVNDTPDPHTPDSIFPNNWISFHEGKIILYPMYAENRRAERKQTVFDAISNRFNYDETIDLTAYEADDVFLEGTGSMVLDRDNKIVYACLSDRTNTKALEDFCTRMNYAAHVFTAADSNNNPIYHTNVMMSVADNYVVICLDAISDVNERNDLVTIIENTGKEILPISVEQMNRFAGNMLQLQNKKGEKVLVMSEQAYRSLTYEDISRLEKHNRIAYSKLDTIEINGGGSARCMIAEVF